MSLKFTIDPNSKLMKTAAILANFTNLPYSPSKNQKRKNINSTEEVEFANNNPKNCKNDLNEIYSSLENLMEDDGNISEPTVLTKDVVKYREILGPICIRLSTEEREYFKNSPTEFAELARSKLQAKYKMIRPDANGDILIFPNTYEDVEAIMNSKSFYPNNIRKNLDKERNSIIITNITPNEITNEERVLEQLKEKGISSVEKVSFKHHDDVKILKGVCINEQTRNLLIDTRFKISIGSERRMVYIEPNMKPFFQCTKCVKFGHKIEQCNQVQVCAKCNESTHKTENCSSETNQCPNCLAND